MGGTAVVVVVVGTGPRVVVVVGGGLTVVVVVGGGLTVVVVVGGGLTVVVVVGHGLVVVVVGTVQHAAAVVTVRTRGRAITVSTGSSFRMVIIIPRL